MIRTIMLFAALLCACAAPSVSTEPTPANAARADGAEWVLLRQVLVNPETGAVMKGWVAMVRAGTIQLNIPGNPPLPNNTLFFKTLDAAKNSLQVAGRWAPGALDAAAKFEAAEAAGAAVGAAPVAGAAEVAAIAEGGGELVAEGGLILGEVVGGWLLFTVGAAVAVVVVIGALDWAVNGTEGHTLTLIARGGGFGRLLGFTPNPGPEPDPNFVTVSCKHINPRDKDDRYNQCAASSLRNVRTLYWSRASLTWRYWTCGEIMDAVHRSASTDDFYDENHTNWYDKCDRIFERCVTLSDKACALAAAARGLKA
jgi:hypothetical protein